MKRLTALLLFTGLVLGALAQAASGAGVTSLAKTASGAGVVPFGQTAREEIKANKFLSGSNYLDYDRQLASEALTPAPAGYVPYYMSHYGRHGSRWLIAKDSYTSVLDPLQKAKAQGKLTAKGEEVLTQLTAFYRLPVADFPALDGQFSGAQLRLGDLTTVGERQHHGIASRMAKNFPEIFLKEGIRIDARSTTVNRCILSMMAECEQLAAANPTIRFHNDVSDALQYYLNQPRSGLLQHMREKSSDVRRQFNDEVRKTHTPDRLMKVLFNDPAWVSDSIKAEQLMDRLFEVVTNMQSHDDGIDMFSLFTEDEVYNQWRMDNVRWYLHYGPAPATGSVMPFSQRNLLRNIIETADTVTQVQATMRFGHEVCVMPLACLMELGNSGAEVTDLMQLETLWRNYKIFPMGCNVQIIFYRPADNADGDILVKVLLNERECTLPVKTTQHPYYPWKELRQYYLDKLDKFDAREKEFQNNQTTNNNQNEATQEHHHRHHPGALRSRQGARVQ